MIIGLPLGAATALTGVLLDRREDLLPEPRLYVDALGMALLNLLVIGPFVYELLPTRPLHHRRCVRWLVQTIGLVGAHSSLYALVHRAMHKIPMFRSIHEPHHRFKKVVIPSAANAVTAAEFLCAYMSPFVAAACFAPPHPLALLAAATIVSAFNLFVHTPAKEHSKTSSWWVSPRAHLQHHRTRAPCYAAPTFKLPPMPTLVVSMAALRAASDTNAPRELASIFCVLQSNV